MTDWSTLPPTWVAALMGPRVSARDIEMYLSPVALRLTPGQVTAKLKPAIESGELRRVGDSFVWEAAALHRVMLRIVKEDPNLLDRWTQQRPMEASETRARRACYANQPERAHTGLAERWALPFFLPVLDWPWLAGRHPDIQAELLRQLYPSLERQAALTPEVQQLIAHNDLPLEQAELALLRGETPAPSAPRGGGHAAAALFLAGKSSQAHAAFARLIGQRRTEKPQLKGSCGLFARLSALHAKDWAAARDPRWASGHPGESLLAQLAIELQGRPVTPNQVAAAVSPLRDHLGLGHALLLALEPLLPAGIVPRRPELPERYRQQGLLALLEPDWGAPLRRQEPWRTWLDEVRQQASKAPTRIKSSNADREVAWQLEDGELRPCWFDDQVVGDPIPWHVLTLRPPTGLTLQDRKVLDGMRRNGSGYLEHTPASLQAAVGHPRLFFEGQPIGLRQKQQALHIETSSRGYTLQLLPEIPPNRSYWIARPEGGVATFYTPAPGTGELAALLRHPHPVPFEASDALRDTLAEWAEKLDVSFADDCTPLLQTVSGEAPLLLTLQPDRHGLRLGWGFQPLGPDGPTVPAFEAVRTVVWQGHTYTLSRDPEADLRQLAAYNQLLPGLDAGLVTLETALQLLAALPASGIPSVWPEGGRWKLSDPVSSSQLRLQVTTAQEWFRLVGELKIDPELSLPLQDVLELVRRHRGRFVPLGASLFVQLSDQLREQLAGLSEVLEEEGRFSPLAAATVASLGSDQLAPDSGFRRTVDEFEAAMATQPRLPEGLQAELRPYQLEGYRWLVQRARAGCGACLADDMGVGKTLQVLTAMLKLAGHQPHLVICPTSVMANWYDQAQRFAPGLRPALYEGAGKASALEGPGLVICSYRGLLQDREIFAGRSWNVVVCDEAQNIKNHQTQTHKACVELRATARVATTGTPIENHKAELWSIFRFLNPGLLGGLTSFRRRFESADNPLQLRRLVSPFLLRRTKAEVMPELPPRTELELRVDLSPPERTLYEQLRRKAEKSLEEDEGPVAVLAHLTRLRQACCHPELIAPHLGFQSAKFEALLPLLADLRDAGHRVLIFSQFTRLLDLLEPRLTAFSWLRLDGTTPVAERRRRVTAFQNEEADLFLISLKAGGTGLTLTAADYVVHLDPWWNPAAEDQASDRAHRLGQTRPVTIYRLIANHTVEERVVQLHARKRRLADEILAGHSARKLDLAEVRSLLS